jgi:hypothetical protein
MRDRKNIIIAALSALLLCFGLTACGADTPSAPPAQETLQALSEQIASKANDAAAKEYVSLLNGATAEVKNVEARDVRLMDPNRVVYVYETTPYGQLAGFWTARGKISSTASQLTNSQNINRDRGQYGGGNTVTDSIGDDGTYSAEECGTSGIFFFDTHTDAMVTICPGANANQFSDAPMSITSKPLMVMDATSTVTTPIPAHGSTKK